MRNHSADEQARMLETVNSRGESHFIKSLCIRDAKRKTNALLLIYHEKLAFISGKVGNVILTVPIEKKDLGIQPNGNQYTV